MNESRKRGITDGEVEQEIERLLHSDAVKLAKKKAKYDNRRRQYLYCLRVMERKGLELMAAGVTEEKLDRMERELIDEDIYE